MRFSIGASLIKNVELRNQRYASRHKNTDDVFLAATGLREHTLIFTS